MTEPGPPQLPPAPPVRWGPPDGDRGPWSADRRPGAGSGTGPGPGPDRPSFRARVAATIVDLVLVGIAWFVAVWLFLEVLTLTGAMDPSTLESASLGSTALTDQQYALAMFALAILFVLRGLYLVYAWSAAGATPGQQLLRLRTVDARTGNRLSVARAAVRWIVGELPGLGLLLGPGILAWYAAVALSIVRNREARGFHDLAAGSRVARRVVGAATTQGGTQR